MSKLTLKVVGKSQPGVPHQEENTWLKNKLNKLNTQKEENKTEQNIGEQKEIYAEISGKVVYVNATNSKLFHVYAEKCGKKFHCSYDGFLPLREGDALTGTAQYIASKSGKEDKLIFHSPPFVIMGTDEESIKIVISSALRGKGLSYKKIDGIYDVLSKETGGDTGEICALLDKISMYYNYNESDTESSYNQLDYDPYTLFSLLCDFKQFVAIANRWYKTRVLRNLYLLGLNNREIKASHNDPLNLYENCITNPYVITSIPLDKCDNILSRCGRNPDIQVKESGKIVRKISSFMENNGWTGVPTNILLKNFPNLSEYISTLGQEFNVCADLHTIYLNHAYKIETYMASYIKDILAKEPIYRIDKDDIQFLRKDLSDEQKLAVEKSLTNNISVITGGGGCGKTTVIKELVYNLERAGIPYYVASFTGKAVSRIREVLSSGNNLDVKTTNTSTMHMLISNAKNKNKNKNGKNKKEGFKHLILDEASMITIELLYDFVKCFSHEFKITLVGDVNQLPPISWGSLFDSVIESKLVPTTVLRKNHRSGQNNGIFVNSQRIIEYKDPDFDGPPFDFELTDNFSIIPGDIQTVEDLSSILVNNGISSDKIVIISPYNKDLDILNANSSKLYNSNKNGNTDTRGKLWRVSDRVMMTENNYSHNIMNGDEGVITEVFPQYINVKFGENVYKFNLQAIVENEKSEEYIEESNELSVSSLVLSFAVSVHRYQGSENEYVIAYIPKSSSTGSFLNSNLLYTTITRAKKCIWLIGDVESMLKAATTRPAWRCSNFTKRLIVKGSN